MQGKLKQLMKHEGINSTRLAEMLGIQASGISHIMSGRNKPSFDFLLKLLQRFPQINPDWLLLDKGPMYRDEIKTKSASGAASAAKNVGIGDSARGNAGTTSGMGGAGGLGGAEIFGNTGGTGASEGLFGPDNTDIISAGEHSGGYNARFPGWQTDRHVSQTDRQAQPQTQPQAQPQDLRQRVQQKLEQQQKQLEQQQQQQNAQQNPQQITRLATQQAIQQAQQTMQHPVYQSGGFKKSASIERIVVFYKDKTFSEYQPE